MALKDWKKMEKDNWISSNEIINVSEIDYNSYYSTHYFNRKTDKFMFVITGTKWPLSVYDRKGFKTKTQAIKFAKDYMKKHK